MLAKDQMKNAKRAKVKAVSPDPTMSSVGTDIAIIRLTEAIVIPNVLKERKGHIANSRYQTMSFPHW